MTDYEAIKIIDKARPYIDCDFGNTREEVDEAIETIRNFYLKNKMRLMRNGNPDIDRQVLIIDIKGKYHIGETFFDDDNIDACGFGVETVREVFDEEQIFAWRYLDEPKSLLEV